MTKWKKIRLGDVCAVNKNSYSQKEKWDFVNYLDTGSITDNVIESIQYINTKNDKLPSRARRKVIKNSIIYSTVRPNQRHYGIMKVIPKNFLVSTGFSVIDVDSNVIDADYLYYYLTQDDIVTTLHNIAEQSTSAYPSIKSSVLEDLEIEYPDILVQKKIASVLNCINHKIENGKEINKNLEEQLSALYQSWFEDFYLTDGVCPKSWSTQELSTIADISSGKRPPIKTKSYSQEAPIPIVGAASVMGFTSEANHTDKILVTGRVGTHGIVQRFNTPCWTSDNTLVIKSSYYEFTNQVLQRIDYSSMDRGSTQPLITQGDMKKVSVLVPDAETLVKFETFACTLMNQWEANKQENIKLASLIDTLLPKLMSGEIDVSNLDV